ncbi:MAG: hypothetical protein NC388_08795 [Clostridium sp.]|nr:hypothetical protein [Clostridium sp.]
MTSLLITVADAQAPVLMLSPMSGVAIGSIVGFSLACVVFLALYNRRLKEWKRFYDIHNKNC